MENTTHITISPLCKLNGGCMGCCGHNFGTKKEMKNAIRFNSIEHTEIMFDVNDSSQNTNKKDKLIQFRDRVDKNQLRSGVCYNLIEKEGCFQCPLHQEQNNGKDLRQGHCDVVYLCPTAKQYVLWDIITQKQFIDFIESKKLDSLDYSLQMDDNSILQEFLMRKE